ncbi:uncharacterized protein LOC135337389 [Halichondria panicea]|uniref:uncharacterized protein LOC135337389 n=1 Tax=Halichondria panicea TaxID=6063 RepID=UPI00312BAB3D
MSVSVSDGVSKMMLKGGIGDLPNKGDKITVHCTGSLAGKKPKKFWSTKDRGQSPFQFQVGLGKVIQGWDEGCMTMKRGEVAKFLIAGHKGYGDEGFPSWGIPPGAELIFEIEVLNIEIDDPTY